MQRGRLPVSGRQPPAGPAAWPAATRLAGGGDFSALLLPTPPADPLSRLLGPEGEILANGQRFWVLRPERLFVGRQQRSILITSLVAITGGAGPHGQAGADVQGPWMLWAKLPLIDRHQPGILVAGSLGVSGPAGPVGKTASGGQGSPMAGAEDPCPHGHQSGELDPRPDGVSRLSGPS